MTRLSAPGAERDIVRSDYARSSVIGKGGFLSHRAGSRRRVSDFRSSLPCLRAKVHSGKERLSHQ